MRTRMIHKDFWASEDISELDFFERQLFIGLWCMADREGLVLNKSRRILAKAFPYDSIKSARIEKAIAKMWRIGLIGVLVADNGDGSTCIHVVKFLEYQHIHRNEAASKLKCRYITGNVDTLPGITGSYTSASAYTSASTSADTSQGSDIVPRKAEAPAEAHAAARLLAQLITDNDPKARLPETEPAKDAWLLALDRLNRIDGRSWPEIEAVIRWSQNDDFWQANILSPLKLRKQFPTLRAKMNSKAGMTKTERSLAALAAMEAAE